MAGALGLLLTRRRDFILALFIISAFFLIAAYRRNLIWKDEATLWEDVIKKSPNKATGYNFAALAYSDKRDFDRAITYYQKAVQIKPDFDAAYTNLGTAYAARGRHEEAIQAYRKAVEIDANTPSAISAYNNLGIEDSSLGQYEEAADSFKKAAEIAAEIDPKMVEPLNNLGMLYDALGRHEDAIELFKKAIAINPNYQKAYRQLVEAYKSAGKIQEAEELTNKIKRITRA